MYKRQCHDLVEFLLGNLVIQGMSPQRVEALGVYRLGNQHGITPGLVGVSA